MIVDAHTHLEAELPADRLLATMDAAGVERAILLAAAQEHFDPVPRAGAAFFRGCLHVPPFRMPMYRAARHSKRLRPFRRPNNDQVLEAARNHADRFIPLAFVNAALGDEVHDELDRTLELGARGLKLHPWLHDYRLTDAVPLLERCEARGLPVLAHLGVGPAEDVEAVMERLPKLKLVLAHAGVPHFERLWGLPRIRFDVALPALVSERTIRRLLEAVGAERVLFGTDAPVGIRDGEGHRYRGAPLPDRAMGANALDLFE